jgi:hypothetical protein
MLITIYLISCFLAFLGALLYSHLIAKKDHDLSILQSSFLNFVFSIVLSFFWFVVLIYYFYTISLKLEKKTAA